MKFKEFRMMDCSTGHIEKVDCDLLEDSDELSFSVAQYEEGFYINLACVDIKNLPQDCAKFSQHFQRVLRIAKEAGFDYINFDRDGTEYPDLPTFDW